MKHSVEGEKTRRQPASVIPDPSYEHLLCDVVHKIKNGLGGIGGFAGLLDRDIDADDKRKRLVRRIQEGVIKVNDIVVALMILVRNTKPVPERMPVRPMIKDVWINYQYEIGRDEKTDSNGFDLKSGVTHIVTDPQLFQHLIYHTFRFIDLVGGNIESVRWMEGKGGGWVLCFHFRENHPVQDEFPGIDDMVAACDSLEARLSIAIVQKISDILHGGVILKRLDVEDLELQIEIQKGTMDQ